MTERRADPNRQPANAVGQLIQHPDERMTLQQRARQMWCIHPADQAHIGFQSRQAYKEAHVLAAIRQSGHEPPEPERGVAGLQRIMHPNVVMTAAERARQMTEVTPQDLDLFGMMLQEFYQAHLVAAVRQVGGDPTDRWSAGDGEA